MTVVRTDAVVIGAGAGGLCAAARLAHAGLHTIVVDDKDRVGGRASTEQIDGFTVNIGAIAIELGGVFEATFSESRTEAACEWTEATRECSEAPGDFREATHSSPVARR